MNKRCIILSADWVFPVEEKPIANGAVAITAEHILAVDTAEELLRVHKEQGADHIHYSGCAITPGFINLHSHLDYSALRFINSNLSLFEWIPVLMKSASAWDQSQFLESAMLGARLLALSGVTTVVDSSYTGLSAEAIAQVGLKGLVGLELFGLDESRADLVWQAWLAKFEARIDKASTALQAALARGRVTLTVAPHAPYTVCPALWRKAKDWAEARALRILAHLAEAKAECAWLGSGSSEIDDYLVKVMPPPPGRDIRDLLRSLDWKGGGHSPVMHLKEHGLLGETLLAAHCIHVDESDLAVLAEQRIAVAHCPRSNSRLRNGRAPLELYRSFEIDVGLGTDSLASVDDLNPINEARFAINLHRAAVPHLDLSSADGLRMLTIDAAKAIGKQQEIGSIAPGKRADLAVIKLLTDEESALAAGPSAQATQASPTGDPEDLVIRAPSRLQDLYVDGDEIISAGRLRISAASE